MKRRIGGLDLWVEEGGSGDPTLLLCHGQAATGEVWRGLREILEARWPGSWIVPDLRGHGRSGHAGSYAIAFHAADLAELAGGRGPVIAVGHSMGGQAAMVLASGWFGVEVAAVIALGVKCSWTDDEVAGAHRLAASPARWFDTRAEAVDRFLKVSGLAGFVAPDSAAAGSGVVEEGGRFRLAADMRTALVVGADTGETHLQARRHARVVLACGAGDPMAPIEVLRTLDSDAVVFKGLGHNAHVEDPAPLFELIAKTAGI